MLVRVCLQAIRALAGYNSIEFREESFERHKPLNSYLAAVFGFSKLVTRHSLLESLPGRGSDRLQASSYSGILDRRIPIRYECTRPVRL